MALGKEQAEHINIVNWFNWQYPDLADDFHHFANERKCSVQQGRTLKRMGVKKGVADFFLAIPLNGKAGLWIELKVGKNKPTKEQIAFAERKIKRHYEFAFVWGYDAAKEMISTYLKPLLANSNGIMLISCT
jgi:hypothetical protein